MVAAHPHQAGRCAPAADPAAAEATKTPQATARTQAAEEVMTPMTATVAAMHTVARQHPAGRAALALIWLGLLVGTCGLWQLHVELHRHPLPGGAA